MYTITAKGKSYTYLTLEAAKACANEIFDRTGIIVGIEAVTEYNAKGATIKAA